MYNKGMMFGGLKQLSEKMTAHVTALTHVREYCGRPYILPALTHSLLRLTS